MKKRALISLVGLVMLLAAVSTFGGCVVSNAEEPFFEDRTTGWKPELSMVIRFSIDELDANGSDLWQSVLDFKPFVYSEQITSANFPSAAKEAMELNFGHAFSEEIDTQLYRDQNTIGFITPDAAVLFEPNTGRLKFCADIQGNDALTEKNGSLILTVDAAALTATQLAEVFERCNYKDHSFTVHIEDAELPLTAKGAYDLSVGMDLAHTGGSPRLQCTGGAFRVYYSDVSDAFFVVTNTYIQAFDISTGKLLVMNSYGCVDTNDYPYGRDTSTAE